MFKDDPVAVAEFRQYELELRETARIEQEELKLKDRLVEIRKNKNITQKELESRTGLSQQAISRFETGSGVNLSTIIKYAEGIKCMLMPVDIEIIAE